MKQYIVDAFTDKVFGGNQAAHPKYRLKDCSDKPVPPCKIAGRYSIPDAPISGENIPTG